MIGTVGRLERLLEFIGVHMLFDLIIDCPLGELRQKAKIRDRPIVFVSSRPGFFRSGVTIASLKFGGTSPLDREAFMILVIAGAKASEHRFSRYVGIGSRSLDFVGVFFSS